MTDTIPRPRADGAGADDASESEPLLICAPLRIEARAVRRGLPGGYGGAGSPPVSGGIPGVVPPGLHCSARGTEPRARRSRPGR